MEHSGKNMASILKTYNRLNRIPFGRAIFAKSVGYSAPFFRTIKAKFIEFKPAYCETQIRDRWGVRNHLGTINAGALCSLAEMTGGLALDSVVPNNLRWIPRGMTVNYLNKATGVVTAISEFDPSIVVPGDVLIPIVVSNESGEPVFNAQITFYLSEKPSRTKL
ncbi:MAG: acyl-coenzyme A thioesterase PaaI-like protein [Pseudoalteromonas tetraodonis]